MKYMSTYISSEVEEDRVGLEYMENDDFYKGHVDSYHVEW